LHGLSSFSFYLKSVKVNFMATKTKNKIINYTVTAADNDIIKDLAKKLGIRPDQVIIRGVQVMQLYAGLKGTGKKLMIKDEQNNEQELILI
jgi:hypothetical protein